MPWLDRIVHSFIMTFGITQPSPERRVLANRFIGFLLAVIFLGFFGIIFFGVRHLMH